MYNHNYSYAMLYTKGTKSDELYKTLQGYPNFKLSKFNINLLSNCPMIEDCNFLDPFEL